MKKAINVFILYTFFLSSTLFSLIASADPINWQTATEVAVGDCIHYAGCTSVSTASDGGMNVLSSASSLDLYGASAEATAEFTGDGLSPLLRASAIADNNSAAAALAYGAQGYQYTGSTTATITADITLTFRMNGASVEGGDHGAGIFAHMGFYEEAGFGSFDVTSSTDVLMSHQPQVYPGGGDGEGEGSGARPDAIDVFGFNQRAQSLNGQVYRETGTISITLNPLDTFYVFGALGVQAMATEYDNAYADASNTLLLDFSDSRNLVAFGVPETNVPEPASLALLAAMLLFLSFRKRQFAEKRIA